MKKLYVILLLALLPFAAIAQDGKSIYRKYSDSQDVSDVYISSAMFRMMERLPDMEVKDSGETVHIYTNGSDSVITGLVLVTISDSSCTFIRLDGTMSRQMLEQALAK